MQYTKAAVVFPGQGSQRPGMGKDFFDQEKASRLVFEEASQVLGWDVARMCFEDNEKLHLTEFAQPCILTTEMAMLRGLHARYGLTAEWLGGHSLGEYAALVAAGVFQLADAVAIVQERGRLMQQASPEGEGGMAAVIAGNIDESEVETALEGLPIDLANLNSRDQVVVSGRLEAMAEAEKRLRQLFSEEKRFRFVPLAVSAPFHSRFMQPAAEQFSLFLKEKGGVLRSEGAVRVTSNYTGTFHTAVAGNVIDGLASQLSGPVRWRDNMAVLAERATHVIEIGPNRPLRAFFKTIGVEVQAVTSVSSAARIFEE